jgi:uncharacterized membrane protein YeaQ/YmgE (transglycosylase-associated protein family)
VRGELAEVLSPGRGAVAKIGRSHFCWSAAVGFIGTVFVGLIVGALARFVLPGEQKMGWILTILLGIGGSMLAGFVGQAMGWYHAGQGAGWIASVLGAVVLLVIVGKLRGGSSS